MKRARVCARREARVMLLRGVYSADKRMGFGLASRVIGKSSRESIKLFYYRAQSARKVSPLWKPSIRLWRVARRSIFFPFFSFLSLPHSFPFYSSSSSVGREWISFIPGRLAARANDENDRGTAVFPLFYDSANLGGNLNRWNGIVQNGICNWVGGFNRIASH